MSALVSRLTARRAVCRLLAAGLAALASGAVLADAPAMRASDWNAIKKVIADQRTALIAGDGEKAFGYATPSLRAQFGDAVTFMAMVHLGYPTLLSARYTEFLEGAVIDGLIIQPLRLIDADNSVRVALYTMEKQEDGGWRISGCRIAPSTVQAAQLRTQLRTEWRTQWRPSPPWAAMRSSASSNRLA